VAQELLDRGAHAVPFPVALWDSLCRVPLEEWLIVLAVELYVTLWSLSG
jgi:hypothetical protein